MRCSIMIEPDAGQPYGVVRSLAQRAESLGFSGFYCSDHYEPAFDWFEAGAPDSWALLAALAVDTTSIAIGTLVTPVTLRRIGTLAKVVSTVSAVAVDGASTDGVGRVHLGLGAGWLEAEHTHYALPFGTPRERFDRLEEHLEALTALWDPTAERTSFSGDHVTIVDAPFAPKPVPRPRIILGGRGRVRMPVLAARFADELNVPYMPEGELLAHRQIVDEACDKVGRDPATLALSAKRGVLAGRTSRDVRDRAVRMRDMAGDARSIEDYLGWLSERWIVGTVEEVAAQVALLRRSRVDHLVLQDLLPDDDDLIDVLADAVTEAAAGRY